MRTIIVDDEPKAISLLEGYLQHFPSFQLVGTFRNALKALNFLSSQPVKLVFLDINMPHLSGLALSRLLPPDCKLIFTTAYAEHAVESYEVNASDYLLKPISLERFSQAIAKIIPPNQSQVSSESHTILIKSGTKIYQRGMDTILFLQKDGNYIYYQGIDQRIMARQTVQEALSALSDKFIQVHKSYIVNVDCIQLLDGNKLKIGDFYVPISNNYRPSLLAALKAS